MTNKNYPTLIAIPDFNDRLKYLMLYGTLGDTNYNNIRSFSQDFYKTREWYKVRYLVIERDGGLDLGHSSHHIYGDIHVHHIIPLSLDMLKNNIELALDPNNLISTSFQTHLVIHYARHIPMELSLTSRKPNDTKLW